MNFELKKAIIEYMIENIEQFQLVNATTQKFRQYIFTPEGDYCIGGQYVSNFISAFESLIKQ